MTPRSLLLTVVALFCLFWLALALSHPTAVAQPDDPDAGSAVDAAQLQQEQPVLIIQTDERIIQNVPAHFTATVTIDPETYTYTWGFGDGSSGQGRKTEHIFRNAGEFQVTASATRNGQRLEATIVVQVIPELPPAPIEGLVCTQNGPVEANNPVRLEASVAKGEPATYSWSVGEPGVPPLDGPVVTHRYRSPGVYRATVTARNPVTPRGVDCTVAITVFDETIAGLDFSWTGKPHIRAPIQFDATIVRGTSVSYVWFFGDGTRKEGKQVNHPFNELGPQEVTVVASNSRNTLQRTRTLLVVPQTPDMVGSFNDGPKAIGALLIASASMVGENPNTSYTWRWGDGSPADTTTESSASHRYTSAGVYGIQVIASNDGGAAASSQIAYIGRDSPMPTLLISHSFSTNMMVPISRPVTLTAIFDPPLLGAQYEDFDYFWDWGDGTTTPGRAYSLAHTYFSANNFVVQVTATERTTEATPLQLYGATVVLVAPNLYFPLIAQTSLFTSASPSVEAGLPTPTSTPIPEATATSDPVATEEPEPGATDEPDPGETQQPEPSETDEPAEETPSPLPSAVVETPSPTATPTVFNPTPNPPSATATPTPTQTREEGGTIPPVSSN